MYFWTGVSTVAGALRRCVLLDLKHFQWVPNFYVILVAPPGVVAKSTTASIGMNLLRDVPGINFGPDVVTWQALAQALGNACEEVPMPDGFSHPMSAITIESSEFGTFLNPSDREMVDLLVHLWDGKKGVFKKLTKTQGADEIINPWVNIIACTTPSWIEGNFPEYMIGGGFTSRCVFVYAEEKRQYVPYPHLVAPKDFDDRKARLTEDLARISELRGPFDIAPDALAWGQDWYVRHYENRPKHLDNDRFGGYLARKQTHIHKLAMILSASQKDELVLTKEDLKTADKIMTSLEADMPKVFEKIGTSPQARGQAELVSLVRSHKVIQVTALYKLLFRTLSWEDFNAARLSAAAAGHVAPVTIDGQPCLKAIYGETKSPDTGANRQPSDGTPHESVPGGNPITPDSSLRGDGSGET